MKKYQTTKKECQDRINELGNVCDRCGRKIKPLKTVDNAGSPTYWSGCMHGEKSWGHFSGGVKKEVYDLAVNLVLEDGLDFCIKRKQSEQDFEYSFQNAVSHACGIIRSIEYAKVNKPRYTKKQLSEKFIKY